MRGRVENESRATRSRRPHASRGSAVSSQGNVDVVAYEDATWMIERWTSPPPLLEEQPGCYRAQIATYAVDMQWDTR